MKKLMVIKTTCFDFTQVEFHPMLYQKDLLEYCKSKGIQLQAYTSLGQGKVYEVVLFVLSLGWPISQHEL